MPTFPDGRPNDTDSVVRGTISNLNDPRWWRSLKIDAVAFICWGFAEHTPIIHAAREGGIKTYAIFDSNCSGFPYFNFFSTIRSTWRKGYLSESTPKRIFGTAARISVFLVQGLISNYQAYIQARTADLSGYNSQSSFERAKRSACIFGGKKVISTMHLMGYPIPDTFSPQPFEKRIKKVVAVARWDATRHKRPDILMKVAEQLTKKDSSVVIEIFGRLPEKMIGWHERLPETIKPRITLSGVQTSSRVTKSIGESMILYCPSAMEGVPLPVVEGLCGGCSVVGLKTDDVPGLAWAFQEGDGTPIHVDTVEEHVTALLKELNNWKNGERSPLYISTKWSEWFSASSYAKRLVKYFHLNI
jgi:glycosyltransferase involved in cell wall biosynthesis